MTELIVQILATLALILGVAGGEIIATRAFGKMKKSWMYLLEIFLFVLSIVVVLRNFEITKLDSSFIILFYFLTGLVLIIFIRSLMTGFGILSESIKEMVMKTKKQEDYIIGMSRALRQRGIKGEEAEKILKETGFDEEKIYDVLDYLEK